MPSPITHRIQEALPRFIRTHAYDIILPNFFVGRNEMDIFRMTKSGYIEEYEIKVSKQDFKNDFDKPWKHAGLESGQCKPNKFWFVCPNGLIGLKDVPEYAGLIYYTDRKEYYGRMFEVKKTPKLLHKDKNIISYQEIAQRTSAREWGLRKKYNDLRYQLEKIKTQNKLFKSTP